MYKNFVISHAFIFRILKNRSIDYCSSQSPLILRWFLDCSSFSHKEKKMLTKFCSPILSYIELLLAFWSLTLDLAPNRLCWGANSAEGNFHLSGQPSRISPTPPWPQWPRPTCSDLECLVYVYILPHDFVSMNKSNAKMYRHVSPCGKLFDSKASYSLPITFSLLLCTAPLSVSCYRMVVKYVQSILRSKDNRLYYSVRQ